MAQYIGYCENLPNLRGKVIRVPKGAHVYTTAPGGDRGCLRSHHVRVLDVVNGSELTVARKYGNQVIPVAHGRSVATLLEELGQNVPDDTYHNLTGELLQSILEKLEPVGIVRHVGDLIRVIDRNPRIEWVGSGQYYYSTDLNNVSW